jgi:predicted Rossmann-fold nucleotide-binding protein
MKTVCVFCGSSAGRDPSFRLTATAAGSAIARAGLSVVYGGGKVGLMGAVADGALATRGPLLGDTVALRL